MLNIVKLRYAEIPAFLDLGFVINQYEYAAERNASLGWDCRNQVRTPGAWAARAATPSDAKPKRL